MIVGFDSHSADNPDQSDEDLSSNRNPVADNYFLSESEGTVGLDLIPIFVLVARMLLV